MTPELKTATEKITAAVEAAMRSDPPRDMNKVWRSVVMDYSKEFVQTNLKPLQDAFYAAEAQAINS